MKRLIACVAVALFAVACNKDGGGTPTDPSQVNVEFSFSDLTPGTGAVTAAAGNQATLNFELWLYNPSGTASKGTRIQGSTDANPQGPGGIVGPVDFVIGAGRIIPGFDQGVRGMRVGGKRRIYMPPSLAYGSQGSPPSIPPNASLVFEVELTRLVQ